MDAPLCKLCQKRHYGLCAAGHVPAAEKPARSARKKKSVIVSIERPVQGEPQSMGQYDQLDELRARLESLEARVLELENRKKYMRKYQRDRRAKEKGDG